MSKSQWAEQAYQLDPSKVQTSIGIDGLGNPLWQATYEYSANLRVRAEVTHREATNASEAATLLRARLIGQVLHELSTRGAPAPTTPAWVAPTDTSLTQAIAEADQAFEEASPTPSPTGNQPKR